MVVVVEPLYGCILDGAVHPFDLTIGPWMTRLGEAMLDVEIGTGRLKSMASERYVLSPHGLDIFRRPAVPCRLGEMGPVVGQHSVDLVGHGCCE